LCGLIIHLVLKLENPALHPPPNPSHRREGGVKSPLPLWERVRERGETVCKKLTGHC
jgi:hypothetical protein